jgi:spermidine/putrescine transport system substrate-binding protein
MWMDFYYQPAVAARVADWVNYITPVPDAKPIIANDLDDAAVANSPLVFPTSGINAHDYRVFSSQEEAGTWNGIFGAIATNP